MPRSHWTPIVLAGLAVLVAACGASSPTTSASAPGAAASSTFALASAAAPTPSTATPMASAAAAAPSATAPGSATDAYLLLAGFQGHFTGSWNDATFGTTGSMTWGIAANPTARTVNVTVNVGGHFFGGSGAPPESITLTHLGEGVIAGHSASFGDVSGTITPGGALHISLSNIPGGAISRVDITGAFTGGNAISMSYTVSFAAGGRDAVGTVTLNRA